MDIMDEQHRANARLREWDELQRRRIYDNYVKELRETIMAMNLPLDDVRIEQAIHAEASSKSLTQNFPAVFAEEFGIDYMLVRDYGNEAFKFIRFMYENKDRKFDMQPLKTFSSETLILVLPFIAHEDHRRRLQIPDPKPSRQIIYNDLREALELVGLTAPYIQNMVMEYSKFLLR